MKKIISLLTVILIVTASAVAQTWTSDLSHSRLGFTVKHLMISTVSGNFKKFEVKAVTTKPDYSDAQIELTAQIASINTDNERRDGHLNGVEFFDAEKFPTLTFKSTKVQKINKKNYKLTGNLTMRGVTKQVVLNLEFVGKTVNPMNKKEIAVFNIKGTFNRLDFAVGDSYNKNIISNEVNLDASMEMSPVK